jgi:anaerobic dimethyl sulfoxide reductase subunit B (iron-sulfur subunit)
MPAPLQECMIACIDKKQPPDGVFFRRVSSIRRRMDSQRRRTYEQNVFSYYCPSPATLRNRSACALSDKGDVQDENGIVSVDPENAWAAATAMGLPYSAPQFNAELGKMTKCDFSGTTSTSASRRRAWPPAPQGSDLRPVPGAGGALRAGPARRAVADTAITQPNLLFTPSATPSPPGRATARSATPRRSSHARKRMESILFTILVQTATGLVVVSEVARRIGDGRGMRFLSWQIPAAVPWPPWGSLSP